VHVPARIAGVLGAPEELQAWAVTNTGLSVIDLENYAELKDKRIDLPVSSVSSVSSVLQTRSGLRIATRVSNTAFDWRARARRALCRVEVPGALGPSAVSPDGMRLACVLPGRLLGVFDAHTGKQTVVCADRHEGLWAVTFSADCSKLAGAGDDKLS